MYLKVPRVKTVLKYSYYKRKDKIEKKISNSSILWNSLFHIAIKQKVLLHSQYQLCCKVGQGNWLVDFYMEHHDLDTSLFWSGLRPSKED